VNRDIAALDTPGQLRTDATALTGRIELVVRDLRKIAKAARRGDKKGGKAANVALANDAKKVNQSQNRLALATGADVGQR
jgi:hypothetical protein